MRTQSSDIDMVDFSLFHSTGESGLVYRGYIKVDQTHKLVAIKTGKGDHAVIKKFIA